MPQVSDPGAEGPKRNLACLAGCVGLMIVVGATQSWDIIWLAAIVGIVASVYLRGTGVQVPFQGDATNLIVIFRPWPSEVFGKIAVGTSAFGLIFSNILYPSGPSVLAWGLLFVLVLLRWRKSSSTDGSLRSLIRRSPEAEPVVRTPETDVRGRFSEDIFHQAGLVWKSPATKESVVPQVGHVALDRLGRPYFVVKMIEGKQTLDTWTKAGPAIASAWGVLRVLVEQGRNVNTGLPVAGTVVVTAIVREFVRNEPVQWTTNRVQLDNGINVVDHLSHLPMGEMADSTEPWMLSCRLPG